MDIALEARLIDDYREWMAVCAELETETDRETEVIV